MDTVIVVSNHGEIVGGGEISLLTLLSGLDRSRWAPIAVLPAEGPMAARCRGLGIPTYVIPLPGLRWPRLGIIRGVSALVRLAKDTRASLLHANGSRAMFYAGMSGRLVGLPVIWHLRISDPDPRLDWLLSRLATRIIAISEAVKARLSRWPRAYDRCCVVPNGLDLSEFVPAKEPKVIRDSLGIPLDGRVIGTVGRLVAFKGHRYLLQAFARIRRSHPRVCLLIVGDGPERATLEEEARRLGIAAAVWFAGHRQDVADLLGVMEIFVLPSLGEHFGRVLLEAMALEKPIVGTSAGGVPEVVEESVTGFLVPPADPEGLAAGIVRLLDDPAQSRAMGCAGRRRVEQHFSLTRHVGLVEEVYAQAVQGDS